MANIVFFQFPKSEDRQVWISKTKRVDPKDNRKQWTPPPYAVLCSRHFVDSKPTVSNPHPTLFEYNGYMIHDRTRPKCTDSQGDLPRRPATKRTNLGELFNTRKGFQPGIDPSTVSNLIDLGYSDSENDDPNVVTSKLIFYVSRTLTTLALCMWNLDTQLKPGSLAICTLPQHTQL